MKHERSKTVQIYFFKNRRKKQSANFLATFGIKGSGMGIKKSINNGLLKPAPPSFLRGHIAFSLSSRHSSPSSSIWFIPERPGVRGNGNQHFSPRSSSRVFPLPAGAARAARAAAAASTASPAAFSKPLPHNTPYSAHYFLFKLFSWEKKKRYINPY